MTYILTVSKFMRNISQKYAKRFTFKRIKSPWDILRASLPGDGTGPSPDFPFVSMRTSQPHTILSDVLQFTEKD